MVLIITDSASEMGTESFVALAFPKVCTTLYKQCVHSNQASSLHRHEVLLYLKKSVACGLVWL